MFSTYATVGRTRLHLFTCDRFFFAPSTMGKFIQSYAHERISISPGDALGPSLSVRAVHQRKVDERIKSISVCSCMYVCYLIETG